MAEKKTFQTLDLYLASFLAFHGIPPSFETITGKVVFVFPCNDDLYRLIAKFSADDPVPCNSFATTVKMLRGRMLSMRGQK
jgi:hypothetical protein